MSVERRTAKQKVVYTYKRISFSRNKEENSAICYNMNKPRRHFAREKKLVIQGQILYGPLT